MKLAKYGIAVLAAVMLSGIVFAAAGDAVTNKITRDGWVYLIHLRAMPEKKQAAQGTHHLAVVVRDSSGEPVANATISYAFVQNEKEVTSGQMAYKEGPPAEGQQGRKGKRMGMGQNRVKGHYGAEIMLPKPGAYTLNLSVKVGEKTTKVSTPMTVP